MFKAQMNFGHDYDCIIMIRKSCSKKNVVKKKQHNLSPQINLNGLGNP